MGGLSFEISSPLDGTLPAAQWPPCVADAAAPTSAPGWVLAYADSVSNPIQLFALRDERGRCVALATGVTLELEGNSFLSIEQMGTAGPGLYAVDDNERPERAAHLRRLLEEIVDHARVRGFQRVLLGSLPVSDAALLETVAAAGFRNTPCDPDHVISVGAQSSFDEYMLGIKTSYRTQLRRDLHRAEKGGAVIQHEVPPSPLALTAGWAWYLEKYERLRRGYAYEFRSNLFESLAARYSHGEVGAMVCARPDELLGVLLYLKLGTWWNIAFIGHASDETIHIYAALHAWTVRYAIEHGARRITLCATQGTFKRRLGAIEVERTHAFCATRTRPIA